LTGKRQQSVLDQAVRKSARGIFHKDASAEQFLKAIEQVHQGEIGLDRGTLGRFFTKLREPTGTQKYDSEAEMRTSLTGQERQIIELIVQRQGASNKAWAGKLFISKHTLRNHLISI
jgi:two-component system nitrate/nitrite response regulator NarL